MEQFWVYLTIALVLFVAEIFTGSFVLIFFAFGSAAAALARMMGSTSFMADAGIFGLVSVASLIALRKRLLDAFHAGKKNTHSSVADLGQTLTLTQDLLPGQDGRTEYQGTTWMVHLQGTSPKKAGETARIVRVDGVKLILE